MSNDHRWLKKFFLPEVLGDTFDVPEDGFDEKDAAFEYFRNS